MTDMTNTYIKKCIKNRPSTFREYFFDIFNICPKFQYIFGQGFQTIFLVIFSLSFAKLLDVQNPCFLLVQFRPSTIFDFRLSRNIENFRQTHGLNISLTKKRDTEGNFPNCVTSFINAFKIISCHLRGNDDCSTMILSP